jgi:hypothetical protein
MQNGRAEFQFIKLQGLEHNFGRGQGLSGKVLRFSRNSEIAFVKKKLWTWSMVCGPRLAFS